MKLEMELIPETVWFSNLRTRIPTSEWDKIRKQSYANANYRCQICGSNGKNQIHTTRGSLKGTLNCHEVWEYDNKNCIQKLKGFIALCGDCHLVKHFGLTQMKVKEWDIDINKVIKHFLKVNKVDRKAFDKHFKKTMDTWNKRSEHEWTTDLAEYKNLVKEDNQKIE
ncbi:MAG: HNH endonuclease [archaeon]